MAMGFLPNFEVQGLAGAPFRYLEICMENDTEYTFGSFFFFFSLLYLYLETRKVTRK